MITRSDTDEEQPRHESASTQPSAISTLTVASRPDETPRLGDQLQYMPSFLDSSEEDKEMVITNIRARDVALGLRRLPTGFYALVHHSGFEWRTENKRSLALNDDVVEWRDPIPLPSDLSAIVHLDVFASFEFQPMLGAGEQLRKLTTTVEQLFNHSVNDVPFTFSPEDGDVVSPCSSIFVTVKQRKRENSGSSTSTVPSHGPYWSTTESPSEIADATNQGHEALSFYRKHGEIQDLERSIARFGKALNICPLDHPCRAAALSNLAMAKSILCQVRDTDTSLVVPLRLYRNALSIRPVGHVDRPSTLIQLAMVHLTQFQKRKDEVERAQAEALLQEVIQLSRTESLENQAATFMFRLLAGHRAGLVGVDSQPLVVDDPFSHLTDQDPVRLGIWLLERFEQLGGLADLHLAITLLRGLIGSTSLRDDVYCKVLWYLGVALRLRFHCLGELGDLRAALSIHKDAVHLIPRGHPDRPVHLINLGNTLFVCFEHLRKQDDLNEAISILNDAVDVTPDGHPHRHTSLCNLGNCFLSRFKCLGELSDLEHAISMLKDAVHLMPLNRPDKHTPLNNLGNAWLARFERLGEQSDLDEAISTLRDAIDVTPDGHVHKHTYLHNLGNHLSVRFQRLGQLCDLQDLISIQRNAVNLTPDDHPRKLLYLKSFGSSLISRFKRLGKLGDIEDAISTFRDAAELTPHDHSVKSACLNNLGNCFFARFESLGELADLENAVATFRDAVELTPHGHPDKASHLGDLGNSLSTRFRRLGKLGDLADAISRFKDAVELTPHGHRDEYTYLSGLGNCFFSRFEHLGELCDLKNAISMLGDAADLIPHDHPHKPVVLNDFATSFLVRFLHLGELSDLEHGILISRDAVFLTPDDHPAKPSYLVNLATTLIVRFERFGELSDLQDAMLILKNAVDLTRNERQMLVCLHTLCACFRLRFERLGEPGDLLHAISRIRDALELTPDGHPNKPLYLGNLGNCFVSRFNRLQQTSDIDDAISVFRNTVDLTPHSHPDKHLYLGNLGASLMNRFNYSGELRDIEDAILTFRDALDLTPHGHPRKSTHLNNLGASIFARFKHLGELSDLENAISILRDALDLTPHGYPHKASCLSILGDCFYTRFEHLGESCDLEHAISLYSHAASSPIGPTDVRFRASQKWILCARHVHHHSLLHAYSVAIHILPQLAWIGHSLAQRYQELVQGADVVREAAAAALNSGFPEMAVEWLEQGRSIVWGELLQLRSSYQELFDAHPDHARRLRELSAALDHASATREKSLAGLLEETHGSSYRLTESFEQEIYRQHTLAIEREKLLQEIRRFPDFESFLLRKEFSHLCFSAHSGPVVILNAAESRCDALIVLANVDHAIHVPLPNFTLKRSADLQSTFKSFIREEREGKRKPRDGITWETFLSSLWRSVIKPVIDALALSVRGSTLLMLTSTDVFICASEQTTDVPRIFWCPTGPFTFFPIHAAGLYDIQHSEPGHKVSDFVVSSYVPTLATLAPSPGPAPELSRDIRLLAVRQPLSDGQSRLPGVAVELEHIKRVIRNSPSAHSITFSESSVGTVEEVLSLMKEADWVHFACHGIQDAADSGLCLADGRRLKIRDIVSLSRPHGGLAFLSACQTATGERHLSDEAVHITAGMLFAGYAGVVGTLWSISDRFAPDVARNIYVYLCRNGERPDYREAARALHEAIGRLRDNGASFVEWVPFVHVGL